jgi:uncharacterized protein (DUF362 family)
MPAIKPIVSIVRIDDQRTYAAVTEAVRLIGGAPASIGPGKRVVIKVNLTQAPAVCGVTNTTVIDAVTRLLVDLGCAEVGIADAPGDGYTPLSYRIYNVDNVAERYGARLIDLNAEPGVRVDVPAALGREYVMVPRAIAEADAVVSVPTFKLWGNNPLSLSLKNLIGLYGAVNYGYNHNAHEWLPDHPERVLAGEGGRELGAHMPTVAEAITAMNLAVKPALSIIDAVEGGNGRGRNIRLDLVIAGHSSMAADVVGLAVGGQDAATHPNFQTFARWGLGSNRLEDIDVRGVPIADVAFDLTRLHDNVLTMPASWCLRRLSTGELGHIARVLGYYGFVDPAGAPADKEGLIAFLAAAIERPGYLAEAIGKLTPLQRELLDLLVERGGTATSYYDIMAEFGRRKGDTYVFWPTQRAVMRLGLAYVMAGQAMPYYLLADGVPEAVGTVGAGREPVGAGVG